METWTHGDIDMETLTWRHGDGDMEKWRHGVLDIKKSNGILKTEAQAIFLKPFTVCKRTKKTKRTCPSMTVG
jgi:hypothetical protein